MQQANLYVTLGFLERLSVIGVCSVHSDAVHIKILDFIDIIFSYKETNRQEKLVDSYGAESQQS